jgi:DNA replication and repair protein RecF
VYLKSIELEGFRNFEKVNVEFGKQYNFIFGENAQGKTNLIEAIYLLCLAKSFRTFDDSELVSFKRDSFLVIGNFADQNYELKKVAIFYSRSHGKKIKVDGKILNQFSKLVGQLPIVILSADDSMITSGPPLYRRRFFNVLLCQSFSRYLDDLKKYEKILKQRNRVLSWIAQGRQQPAQELEAWNQQLVEIGSAIIAFRVQIVDEINKYIGYLYNKICNKSEILNIKYKPNVVFSELSAIKNNFEHMLNKMVVREKKMGVCLVGPHRDDYLFSIGSRDLRHFGSRGEHKSTLVSLKAAETILLKQKAQTDPILLLDDLYAELDQDRGKGVHELFNLSGQIFITGPSQDLDRIKNSKNGMSDLVIFKVQAGSIERAA